MQFDEFMAEIEAEAHAEGPDAVAELEAFRAHFAQARTLITPIPALDDDPPTKRIGSGDMQAVERLLSGLGIPARAEAHQRAATKP
jgi:hypothetical protein